MIECKWTPEQHKIYQGKLRVLDNSFTDKINKLYKIKLSYVLGATFLYLASLAVSAIFVTTHAFYLGIAILTVVHTALFAVVFFSLIRFIEQNEKMDILNHEWKQAQHSLKSSLEKQFLKI
jgi:hypothetical protein